MKPRYTGNPVAVLSKSFAAAALLASLSGCAAVGGDRAESAEGVALRMLRAVGAQDGATACADLAPETAAEVEESAEKPCPQAILEEKLPAPSAVTGTAVYGQWAQVRLTGDTVFLAVFPGGWRVVAAGCTPRGEAPYDCILQGG
jgi:hypothetical protein